MSLIRKCSYCGSPWVCWNWIHAFGGHREMYEAVNPHIDPKDLKDWGHECFDCEAINETYHRVQNGLPFWFVKIFHPLWRRIKRNTHIYKEPK